MAAELGPFYMDLKNVPKHFSAERVLKCVQIYEEGSSVEDVTSFDTAKATEREDVYVRRIHEIYSHGYECEPDTKVLRTVWSSRTEPAALASTSRIELDGALLSLCRFGNDVCDRCFSTQHRTSGCARATRRAEEQHVKHVTAKHARRQQRRRAARALRLKSLAVSRQATPPEQQQHDGMGPAGAAEVAASAAAAKLLRASVKVKNFVEEPLVIPPLPPNNDRVGVPMRSTLRPVLFDRRPEAAGALERDSLNGRFNTQSVVDRLSDAYLSAEQRGRMAARGIHDLPALTALELGNGLTNTRYGGARFADLSTYSALASTELNRQYLHLNSTHLEPMRGDLGGEYRTRASKILGKQHGDFF